MKDIGQVFGEDASRKFDFEKSASIIKSDDEEGRGGGDGWWLGIELLKVLLGPLIDSFW